VVADAAIVTLTGRGLLTTIVIIFDVAGPVEQVRLEVNIQVILSLLTGV
jgi:hypothetical protein